VESLKIEGAWSYTPRQFPDDRGTFLPKQLCSFEADTGGSTGDEDDFVRQFHDLLLFQKFGLVTGARDP